MKKTFLKFVFAVTMGISLFSWKSLSANVNAKTIDGTNITMDTTETHTFENATSISLISGDSVAITGNTVKAKGVGLSTIDVDGATYQINYSLPSLYTKVSFVTFKPEAYIDTGYALKDATVHVSFTYTGFFSNFSFGAEAGGYTGDIGSHFSIGNKAFNIGQYKSSGSINRIGIDFTKYGTSKTNFDITYDGTSVYLNIGTYSTSLSSFTGTVDSGYSLYFGKCNRPVFKNPGYFDGNLYDFAIENGGELVRNYIPCYDNNASIHGLYDVINNTFITSISSVPLVSDYDVDSSVTYQSSPNSTIIHPHLKKLYLDSNANFKDLNDHLFFEEGTILKNPKTKATLRYGIDDLNLENLFGEMTSGVEYELNILCAGNSSSNLIIARGCGTANLFIKTDEGYNYLVQNKNNCSTGSLILDDGNIRITESISKIKGRGNHFSAQYEKNSFNLNLEKKQQLIPSAKAQKKYALVALKNCGYDNDTSYISNQSAYTLYEQLQHGTEPIKFTMVNVYIDNIFLGLQMLTERVRIDKDIVDITESDNLEGGIIRRAYNTSSLIYPREQVLFDAGIQEFKYYVDTETQSKGGFILEAGYYYGNSNSTGFITSHGNRWEIKEPQNISLSQITDIALYMQEVENALYSETGINEKGKHYSEYLDLDSIARDFLVRAYMLENDYFNTSTFLYIDGDNNGIKGKMKCGPTWDYDINFVHKDSFRNNNLFYIWGNGGATHDKVNAVQFLLKLLEKGDFFATLENINSTEFVSILNDFINPDNNSFKTIYDFYEDYQYDRQVEHKYFNNKSETIGLARKNSLIDRVSKWNTLWAGDYLEGVTISLSNIASGKELTADAKGASTYQWFKVDEDTGLGVAVSEVTAEETSYIPNEPGKYYVVVTGTAMAPISTTTMTSNVIDVDTAIVTFNMNGHGSQIAPQTISVGAKAVKPNNPYEEDYLFEGWYKEAGCINAWDFNNDVVLYDTVLYAKWTLNGTYFNGNVSISLKDNTWLNFYTDIPEEDAKTYTFKFTLRGGEQQTLDPAYVNKVNSKIRISIPLLPYQLADNVVVYVYDKKNHLICASFECSVRSYAAAVLATSSDETYKNSIKALLNYGAAVQVWQNYHTDDLANSILNPKP